MIDLSPKTSLLKAESISYSRGQEMILSSLSFELHKGEALLVRGANGAGKTTLLRLLSGALEISTGAIVFNQTNSSQSSKLRNIAYVSHNNGHKPELTCQQNLEYSAAINGAVLSHSAIEKILNKLGLSGYADVRARSMSAGQNKRLSLGRLLLSQSSVWLLDEPYANLDLEGIALVNRLIQQHIDQQGAVLLTTHGAYAAPPVPYRVLELTGH